MRPVLEPPTTPRTPEAVAAGDVVLRAALAAVLGLLTLATALAAHVPAPPVSAEEGRQLPFAAATPFDTSSWAGAETAEGRLRVAARGSNGAVATIRDGDGWADYTVRARLRWEGGRAIEMHVRETGPGDFVACVLDGRTARIDEVRGGVVRTLASGAAPGYAGRAFDAVVVADGPRVGFAVDGRTLAVAEVAAERGTAGLAVWDPGWDRGALEADYVRVERAAADLAPVSRTPATSPLHQNVDPGD